VDLKDSIEDVAAKSIFIPRQQFKYSQRPYAFLSFASEIHKTNGMDRTCLAFNNRRLHWVERDRSNIICHHCGNPNHLYKDCPNKRPRPEQQLRPNRWTETYQRMRPDGFKPTNARSQSRSRARSANRRQGFSYASAASLPAKTDLDNSIHAPANRDS